MADRNLDHILDPMRTQRSDGTSKCPVDDPWEVSPDQNV